VGEPTPQSVLCSLHGTVSGSFACAPGAADNENCRAGGRSVGRSSHTVCQNNLLDRTECTVVHGVSSTTMHACCSVAGLTNQSGCWGPEQQYTGSMHSAHRVTHSLTGIWHGEVNWASWQGDWERQGPPKF